MLNKEIKNLRAIKSLKYIAVNNHFKFLIVLFNISIGGTGRGGCFKNSRRAHIAAVYSVLVKGRLHYKIKIYKTSAITIMYTGLATEECDLLVR